MINKRLWHSDFSGYRYPQFPCPKCRIGILAPEKQSVRQEAPGYASHAEVPELEPGRFTMFMKCQNATCGEVVSVIGDVIIVPETDQDGHFDHNEYFEPAFISPAPPIIAIPSKVPDSVTAEIELSFQLYWVDYRVCASRVRTSLERLMDYFGVAKTRIRRSDGNIGKRIPLDLSARIDKLPKKIRTSEHSKILHALRRIGNLGTHGKKVTREAMLDAYQLYEMALNKLFEDKNQTAEAIIKRLKSHR